MNEEPQERPQPKDHHQKRVLFLGYDRAQTRLIDFLVRRGCDVNHKVDKIDCDYDYDVVVSFGYRHIIRRETLNKLRCPVFNLHISYLPYNRGAHPNFWSFYDNTPSGVTIHLIDEGIDTGPIVYQRYVNFDRGEKTFSQTYARLIDEIETMFEQNVDNILHGTWHARPQRGRGTHHFSRELPKEFTGWNAIIDDELKRLDQIKESSIG